MRLFRTVCTEAECINISLGDEIDADPSCMIIIEIQSAKSIADEASGPDVSCEFHIDQITARRFSGILFAAYVATAAENRRSELMDQLDDREYGLYLDASTTIAGEIAVTFELLQRPPHRGLPSLTWSFQLEATDAAKLSEALRSASKVAAEARQSPAPKQ